jgi:hypothetical protein
MRKSYYFMFYASLEPIVYIQFVLNFFYIARKSVNIKIVSPTLRLSQNPRRNTDAEGSIPCCGGTIGLSYLMAYSKFQKLQFPEVETFRVYGRVVYPGCQFSVLLFTVPFAALLHYRNLQWILCHTRVLQHLLGFKLLQLRVRAHAQAWTGAGSGRQSDRFCCRFEVSTCLDLILIGCWA